MARLTLEETKAKLHEIVEAKGADYKYEFLSEAHGDCVYSSREGDPSCIVGCLLYEVNREKFEEIRAQEWPDEMITPSTEGIGTVWSDLGLYSIFEDDVRDLLFFVQSAQDRSETWEYSLEYADKVLAER